MKEYTELDPHELRNHPLNIELYGSAPDPDFVSRVREDGRIFEPVLITPDDVIVSGHRRVQAAKILKIKTVPVVVDHSLTDDLEIQRQLILSNRLHRERTNEQKAREFDRLKKIEAEIGRRKQSEAGKSSGRGMEADTENEGEIAFDKFAKSYSEPHNSEETAAKEVGMSRTNARKASEVVKVVDELEATGDTEAAEELRTTLNKSVNAAHKKIKAPPQEPEAEPTIDDRISAIGKRFDAAARNYTSALKEAESLSEEPGGEYLDHNRLEELRLKTRNAQAVIKAAKPYKPCVYCKGSGCKSCRDTGHMPKRQWESSGGE